MIFKQISYLLRNNIKVSEMKCSGHEMNAITRTVSLYIHFYHINASQSLGLPPTLTPLFLYKTLHILFYK